MAKIRGGIVLSDVYKIKLKDSFWILVHFWEGSAVLFTNRGRPFMTSCTTANSRYNFLWENIF